ncbi:MAG: hypothetical protein IKY71_04755 [Bacteroidaceae bacterium]|nr:hypothetical protein [Bacteroidaceae bacterium]
MKKKKEANPSNNDVQESNLVNKVTLEILNKRHNALARYLGIPCTVPATEVLNGAVMANGAVMHSNDYACYRVDLAPFKGEFDRIRFRATANGDDVVFGMLVDKDGNLESIAKADKPGEATINIPLSTKSKTLFATMPLKKGKPAWKNVTVELLTNGGVIANVNDALNTMLGRIKALEARFQQLLPSYDTEVEISLN